MRVSKGRSGLNVYSGPIAQGMNMDPKAVKEEWVADLLPGIQLVPSGAWALAYYKKEYDLKKTK